MKIVQRKIKSLIHPKYNPRKISASEFLQLQNSLKEFDAVEPAIINTRKNRKNYIVGGNQRIRAAQSLGWISFPCVEVSLTLKKEKELNVKLNKISGEWDFDILAEEFKIEDLKDWGFSESELSFNVDVASEDETTGINEDDADNYSRKVEAPIYTPKLAQAPEFSEMFNTKKTNELKKKINKSKIDDMVQDFLLTAANRHTVFNYEKIAEYYAHAPKNIQKLMEDSALVIIDFNKALENGYIRLSEEIKDAYEPQ